jgi:HEXXH motif-containing protein
VERALELIRANCPAYYAELARVTRQVVVFSHTDVNSFASINVHGTAFFNAGPEHDHVFFMDELVHQCGHVIFNALTVRRKDFLAIDPTTSLRAFAPREQDARTVYDALHGLYTEHVMSSCMRTLDEAGVLSGRQAHELFGRLSFITRKYRVDLRNLSADGMFTELGAVLYTYFQKAYDALVSERPELLATDMSGQPYNFSYELFAQHNPPRADRASHRIAADHAA